MASRPADIRPRAKARTMWRALRQAVLAAPVALFAGCSGPTQNVPALPGETSQFSAAAWQSGSNFSSLAQINRDNVRDLEVAWEYHTDEIDTSTDTISAFEDQPLLIEGNLIICTISRRIIALDPETGRERWVYEPGGEPNIWRKCRGVSAWTDAVAPEAQACKTRLLFATADNRLIAIDARTGQPCAGFGDNGVVQMATSIPIQFPGEVASSSKPAVINGVVVVGSAIADNQRLSNPSGRVVAFDARTGAPRWQFDPLPRARTHPASSDWHGGTAGDIGGANVWAAMSVDEARDLVFLPTSSPSIDYFGGARPGDNRFSDSIVALRGSTGEVVWHFQFVHHDIWDGDLPAAPLLIDYPHEGANVPALVQITKMGRIFIFNRETGEPLVPIEELPAPQGGAVPGEAPLSPTQPMTVGMPTLMPQGITQDDIWGFTPWDRGSCQRQFEALTHGPVFTPPSERGTIFYPGPAGGPNWGGGAYDPASHIMVVPTTRIPYVVTMIPRERAQAGPAPAQGETAESLTYPNEGAPYMARINPMISSWGAPCTRPPWGALTGIDIVNRRVVWEVPLGTIDQLAPVPIPLNMGTPGAGGPLVTAGGLAFVGFSIDHRFRAFDLETGRVLWTSPALPAPANATPVTYAAGGAQYVVVAAGGHSVYRTARSDTVLAYRLRGAPRP